MIKTDAKGIVHTTEMDVLDRLKKKIQVVNGISKELTYGYNTLGQLSSITYPSGLIVNYVYTRGLITSITIGGTTTGTVLSSAAYQPFDNSFPKSYQFNGSRNRITQFDTNEKLIIIAIDSVMSKTITQDGEYNYLSMLDNIDSTKSFTSTYDSNNKIDVFALNGVNNKHYYDDSYNKTSNATMGFNYDIKNRLSSYSLSGNTINLTYDDNGNTLTEGTTVYGYDLRNNLISVNKAGAVSTYGFNGLGQRTIKTVSGDNNYYLYDEAGNLAGEYDNAGTTVSEHIYLNGVPVGLVKANVLYNVHTDQIGTPRVITNAANVVVWKWDNVDPYGGNLPSVQTIVYNKRFSGQYFDNESKLHYNYYRTYNPLVGRYIQSDPLGLAAGFNTYNYVEGNPFGFSDSLGLQDSNYVDYVLSNKNTGYFPRIGFEGEERAKAIWAKKHPNIILFVSHGSPNSMSGYGGDHIFDQMQAGIYKTNNGSIINNIFKKFIDEDKDINILLDVCNVASDYWYEERINGKGTGNWIKGENFVNIYGKRIRAYLNSIGKGNLKVNIMAASGYTSWKFGDTNPLNDKIDSMLTGPKNDESKQYNSKAEWNIFSY